MHDAAIPDNVRRALDKLKRRLAERYGERFVELKLFGSYARGEQRDESDVDVLLLFSEELHPGEVRRLFDEIARIDIEERLFLSPLICSVERFRRMRDEEAQIALDIEEHGIRV